VAGEDEPVSASFAPCRAGDNDQVGLGVVGAEDPVDSHAGPVQIVSDEIRDRQVAVAADRVEPDQAAQEIGGTQR
jgi:hypothetical protein